MSLKSLLEKENKLKWLDIGCGSRFDEGFDYLDIIDCQSKDTTIQNRYTKCNIVNASEKEISALGDYDFIRMQHVLEHFSVEEGVHVLLNCSKVLKNNGILLITVPDLNIFINRYLNNTFHSDDKLFKLWAQKRIAKEAPNSFYFSIFTHSLEHEPHKWCYDKEGLLYILELCQVFKEMTIIPMNHPLASEPFTHNRPHNDLCAMVRKK